MKTSIIDSAYFENKNWQDDFRKLLLSYRAIPYSTPKLDISNFLLKTCLCTNKIVVRVILRAVLKRLEDLIVKVIFKEEYSQKCPYRF